MNCKVAAVILQGSWKQQSCLTGPNWKTGPVPVECGTGKFCGTVGLTGLRLPVAVLVNFVD
jgi:hypothetical protein